MKTQRKVTTYLVELVLEEYDAGIQNLAGWYDKCLSKQLTM